MVQKEDSDKVQNKGVVIARARAEKRWHLRCNERGGSGLFKKSTILKIGPIELELETKTVEGSVKNRRSRASLVKSRALFDFLGATCQKHYQIKFLHTSCLGLQ